MQDVTRNLTKSVSQSHTMEANGHAEDLSDIITNIDPKKTFFLSEFSRGADCTELDFSWMTENLRPPRQDAHFEKEDYVSEKVGSLEGMTNNCQRFVSSGWVTTAQIKVKKIYNPQDEFSRQYHNVFLEHANNIELMLCTSDDRNMETSTNAAHCGGVPYFMKTQNIEASAVATVTSPTAADGYISTGTTAHGLLTGDFVYLTGATTASGLKNNRMYYIRVGTGDTQDATTGKWTETGSTTTTFRVYDTIKAATDHGTPVTIAAAISTGSGFAVVKNNVIDLGGSADYTLDDLNNVMQMCYTRGGNPTLAVMSASKKRRFSSLVNSVATFTRGFEKSPRKLDMVATMYETDFGMIEAKTHPMYADNRIDLMDMNYWELKWFVPTHEVTGIPVKGSYKEFFIESWVGLKGTQPKASGSLLNIAR